MALLDGLLGFLVFSGNFLVFFQVLGQNLRKFGTSIVGVWRSTEEERSPVLPPSVVDQ